MQQRQNREPACHDANIRESTITGIGDIAALIGHCGGDVTAEAGENLSELVKGAR